VGPGELMADGAPPLGFCCVLIFRKYFAFNKKNLVAELLGACDVIDRHLAFYLKIRNWQETAEIEHF